MFDSLPWAEERNFILPEVDVPVFIAPASSVLFSSSASLKVLVKEGCGTVCPTELVVAKPAGPSVNSVV